MVYRDLAFVQQVDHGDEWLVLMRLFSDETNQSYWVPFESVSLDRAISSAARFECSIEALCERDPYDSAVLFGVDRQLIRQKDR